MRPFVITGCARSGTMGTFILLNELGLRTSFEEFFIARPFTKNVGNEYLDWLEYTNTAGEVSGMAVPYLPYLPYDITVIHQVRNPIAVINSLMGLKNFHEPTVWWPNVKFNFRHLLRLKYDSSPLERCMDYWIGWNALVDTLKPKFRIRAEDMYSGGWLENLLKTLEFTPVEGRTYSKNTKNSSPHNALIHLQTLPAGPIKDKLIEMAIAYGYMLDDLNSFCPSPGTCELCGLTAKET